MEFVMHHSKQSIAAFSLIIGLGWGGNLAHADTQQYYGRWTVSDDKPVYSSKGKVYKTIDIAPCGKDFCGLSVDDHNSCGKTLFRFFTTHAADEDLTGHGKWGEAKKKLQMGFVAPSDAEAYVYVALGADDMDISGREGSNPTFDARYKKIGAASCTTE
jgi:hypothetical protein